MYQNSSYRTSGGNNFLWVILSTLIIVILLFAVYINNRNSLGPVIAEVNSITPISAADSSEARDLSIVVNPAEPTAVDEDPKPIEQNNPAENVKVEVKPDIKAEVKKEGEPDGEQGFVPEPVKPITVKPTIAKPDPKLNPNLDANLDAKSTPAKPELKPVVKPIPAKPELAKPEAKPAPKGSVVIDYEIKQGDVMSRIITRYGNTKEEIMKANKLENLDKIKSGQVLKLRIAAQHKVGKNETVSTLAAKYKVDADRIRKINGLKGDQLKAGEVVMVPMR